MQHAMKLLMAGLIGAVISVTLIFVQPAQQVVHTPAELTAKEESQGFYTAETDPSGNRYVWTTSAASTLFRYVGKKPLDLNIELRSAAVAGGPDAAIHVLVNAREIAQIRPTSTNPDFQTFRFHLDAPTTTGLNVQLKAEPFQPPRGDVRTLGTMVKSISLDKSDAWSVIGRRLWLYWSLPIFGALAVLCGVTARLSHRFCSARIWSVIGGYGAIIACVGGTGCMLVATTLLLRMGRIDADPYDFWLFGTAYIGIFFAITACCLPFGRPERPTLLQMLSHRWFSAHRARYPAGIRDGLLSLVAVGSALHFLNAPGMADIQDKLSWMKNLLLYGLVSGFQISATNYPPGTFLILDGVVNLGRLLNLSIFLSYKLSLFAFLLFSALVIVLWTRHLLLTATMYLALVIDSMVLGYNDVYFIPTLLLSLWALQKRRFPWFVALLSITCMIKWQAAIIAPIALLYSVMETKSGVSTKAWLRQSLPALILPAIACGAIVLALFGTEAIQSFRRATSEHWLSANALNFGWVLTHLLRWWDPRTFGAIRGTEKRYILIGPHAQIAMKAFFFVIYVGVIYRFLRARRSFDTMLYYLYVGYALYFVFNASVHENHLVPAQVLAGVLCWRDRRYLPLFIATALMSNINMYLFYGRDGLPRMPVTIAGIDLGLFLASVNVIAVIVVLIRGPYEPVASADVLREGNIPVGAAYGSHLAD